MVQCRMGYISHIVVCVLLVHSVTCDGHGGDTPCSHPEGEKLEECLETIREIAQDNSRFFFGTSFEEPCSGERAGSIDCFNFVPFRNNSIASMMFESGTFQPELIDRFIHVEFTSPPGEYYGCDTHYKQDESISFSLDPSSDKTYTPFHMRETPMIHYEADEDKQYTLMVKDVGFLFLHAVIINIPGNDIAAGQEILPYHGPRNGREVVNPYIVMLFEQTEKDMELHPDSREIIELNDIFTQPLVVNQFSARNNLKGPIAMNWMLVSFDAYSVEIQKRIGLENCGGLVDQELTEFHTERVFVNEDTLLTLNTRVEFHSEEYSFFYCCLHTYDQKTFMLDPIGNDVIDPVYVRTGNAIKIEATYRYVAPIPGILDNFYFTVMVVDPDVPYPTAGTEEKPILHWLVTNARVVDGTLVYEPENELRTYRGPSPPDDKPHTYYFLIYSQNTPYTASVDDFIESDTCDRCLFDIQAYTDTYGLTLSGASWFRSQNNEFVQMNREVPEEETCPDKECIPVGRGVGVMSTAWLLLASILMAVLAMC